MQKLTLKNVALVVSLISGILSIYSTISEQFLSERWIFVLIFIIAFIYIFAYVTFSSEWLVRKDFGSRFFSMAQKAKDIKLIGIGLGFIDPNKDEFKKLLRRVASGKLNFELYLANPYSCATELRLIEEETGPDFPAIKRDGLIQRLHAIMSKAREIIKNEDNFCLKLFHYYPSIALAIIDNTYYFYPYGYTILGTRSPFTRIKPWSSEGRRVKEYLDEQYEIIRKNSVSAEKIIKADNNIATNYQYAVYLIPDDRSEFYRFGSDIIGYDIRSKEKNTSSVQQYVGPAFEFGFHLTVTDALFFSDEAIIKLIDEELEFLVRYHDFLPIELSFKLEKSFPNNNSIAFRCQDLDGHLEALHHELVFRINKKAVGSNYSIHPALADRDQNKERNQLMIRKYQAPYILKSFVPHFSLLSSIDSREMDNVYVSLEKEFIRRGIEQKIEINTIALVKKSGAEWIIENEYRAPA